MTMKIRGDALHWREIEAELVAVDMRTASYLGANPAGALLWQSLATGATRDDLVAALVERFGIDAEQAATDTDAFLAQLDEADLIER